MAFAGVDPGTKRTGLAIIGDAGEIECAAEISLDLTQPVVYRLADIYQGVSQVVQQHATSIVAGAVELPFFGRYPSSVGKLYMAHGAIVAALTRAGVPTIIQPPPGKVKAFVTGEHGSRKDEIRLAVFKQWNFEHASNDVVDAVVMAHMARCLAGGDGYTSAQRKLVAQMKEHA